MARGAPIAAAGFRQHQVHARRANLVRIVVEAEQALRAGSGARLPAIHASLPALFAIATHRNHNRLIPRGRCDRRNGLTPRVAADIVLWGSRGDSARSRAVEPPDIDPPADALAGAQMGFARTRKSIQASLGATASLIAPIRTDPRNGLRR